MHWSYCSLGLGHRYYLSIFFWQDVGIYLGRAKTITSPFSISRIMYVLEWRNVSAPMRVLFGCLFPSLRSNEGNKHQNNTWVSTETVHHESTYIILFLAWHNKSINDNRHVELYRSSPCLTRLVFRSVDNVTIDCWWCHNDQTIFDLITWRVISNSLNINFIYGDILGQLCKKRCYLDKVCIGKQRYPTCTKI